MSLAERPPAAQGADDGSGGDRAGNGPSGDGPTAPRELAGLAPYAARAALSRGRVEAEPEHPYRTAFQRDRDRIVHAAAFRRLEHKTQVFTSTEGDHYRTRLTHTLEATQVARTLARALGLNEDLTEAVSLAHDLGHAPFGHAGEEALKEVMRGHGGFDHNRQALRVVDLLERRHPGRGGLNLTWETRESILKHGHDPSASEVAARAAGAATHAAGAGDRGSRSGAGPAGDLAAFDPALAPLLEGQLVDACDSVAYDAHDLDDGLRAGLLALDEVRGLALWARAEQEAEARHGTIDDPEIYRHAVIRRLLDLAATDLLGEARRALAAARPETAAAAQALGRVLVRPGEGLARERAELKDLLFHSLYRHHRVMRIWRVAKEWLQRLFRAYVEEPLLLPPRWRAHAEQVGRERAACDYVAGMTDRYAATEAHRLFSPLGGLARLGEPW